MEWLTRRIIWALLTAFLVIGIAVAIWEAIPGFIKVLAVIGIVCGFIGILKKG